MSRQRIIAAGGKRVTLILPHEVVEALSAIRNYTGEDEAPAVRRMILDEAEIIARYKK